MTDLGRIGFILLLLTDVTVQMQTLEKVKGVEVLKEACAACAESIATKKGRMVVKEEARVVRAQPSSLLAFQPVMLQQVQQALLRAAGRMGCRGCAGVICALLCNVVCGLRVSSLRFTGE
jgi:hypothetical protein